MSESDDLKTYRQDQIKEGLEEADRDISSWQYLIHNYDFSGDSLTDDTKIKYYLIKLKEAYKEKRKWQKRADTRSRWAKMFYFVKDNAFFCFFMFLLAIIFILLIVLCVVYIYNFGFVAFCKAAATQILGIIVLIVIICVVIPGAVRGLAAMIRNLLP